MVLSSPQQFFSTVKDNDMNKLCKWVGELYLELHRGKLYSTGQGKIVIYIEYAKRQFGLVTVILFEKSSAD